MWRADRKICAIVEPRLEGCGATATMRTEPEGIQGSREPSRVRVSLELLPCFECLVNAGGDGRLHRRSRLEFEKHPLGEGNLDVDEAFR